MREGPDFKVVGCFRVYRNMRGMRSVICTMSKTFPLLCDIKEAIELAGLDPVHLSALLLLHFVVALDQDHQ
jgi:hypothetical protein